MNKLCCIINPREKCDACHVAACDDHINQQFYDNHHWTCAEADLGIRGHVFDRGPGGVAGGIHWIVDENTKGKFLK